MEALYLCTIRHDRKLVTIGNSSHVQGAGRIELSTPKRILMKIIARIAGFVFLLAAVAWAMPLGTNARAVIPGDIQQIISVDYRALRSSDTAMALKAQVLPENLKQFEEALKGVGIDPDKDVEQLTFIAYRMGKPGTRTVGVAQGVFPVKAFLKKMTVKKIKAAKYRSAFIYPMASGFEMTFVDENTLLFGDT